MKKLLILMLLLVLLQGVLANEYYVSVRQQKNEIIVSHVISLQEKQEISIKLPQHYGDINSNNEFTVLGDYIQFNDQKITFSYIQPKSDSFGKLKYFLIRFESNVKISRFVLDFLTDKNYVVKKELIIPANFELISHENINLINWRLNKFNKGEFKIFLEKRNSYILHYLIGFILIMIGFILINYNYLKNKKNKDYLLEDERKFIDLLKNSNRRENWQRKLQEELGFSKAKISRMVRNLESRGLIEKIPIGNTNKIRLK